MQILVTGAAGFIGSHVAEAAVAAGHDVRAVMLPGDDPTPLHQLGLVPIVGDLADPEVSRQAIEGREVVLHAAGRAGDYGPWERYQHANVSATTTLVDAAARGGVRRFVHASSYMVSIGGSFQHWAGGVIDDRTPDHYRYWSRDHYGRTKVAAEQAVLRAQVDGRFEVVPLRIGWVYGPRDQTSFPGLVDIVRSGRGVVIGSGRNRLGLVYVSDVADCFLMAAAHGTPGQPYVLAGVAGDALVSQSEYLDAIADLIGVHRPRVKMPFGAADVMGRLMEETWPRLGRKHRPLLTSFAVHLLGRDQVFDTRLLRADTGWTPRVTFEDGMARTMSWLEGREASKAISVPVA
jgi:nucleoside-diphosphate-sugar epimerase